MARCRTAFQSSQHEDSKKPADLVGFYREAILTKKKVDSKYKKTLPRTIHNVVMSVSDDELAPSTGKRKGRQNIPKGANKLYPEEQKFIAKWWKDGNQNQNQREQGETNLETEIRRRTDDLRPREIQLQILLILETIALELALGTSHEPDADVDADAGERSVDEKCIEPIGKEKGKEKGKKKKTEKDLNVLLEQYIDLLSIRIAVSSGEGAFLQEFCTEVIVPFYAARLPEKCKLITRKFGVSRGTSSAAAAAAGNSNSNSSHSHSHSRSASRHDSDMKRQQLQQQQQQQSLKRPKTDPTQWEEAMRKSTEPVLPTRRTSVRGGIQKPNRPENREVDLNATAKQYEVKLKKMQTMVDQKKELDAAITALRRPNRELVSRDMADAAEKRLSSSNSVSASASASVGKSSRKPKNPVRNPLGHGVQVAATPRGSRSRQGGVGVQVMATPKGSGHGVEVMATPKESRPRQGGVQVMATPKEAGHSIEVMATPKGSRKKDVGGLGAELAGVKVPQSPRYPNNPILGANSGNL